MAGTAARTARQALLGVEKAAVDLAVQSRQGQKAQLFSELQGEQLPKEGSNGIDAPQRRKLPTVRAVAAAEELDRQGFLETTREFTMAASALLRAKAWQQGLHLLRVRLPAASLAPDAVARNAMVAACAAGSHWAGALQLLFEQQAADSTTPSGSSLRAGIDACAKATQWHWSLALLSAGWKPGSAAHPPDLAALAAAVKACGRAEHWAMALTLLFNAEAAQLPGAKVDTKGASQLLEDVLGALARGSRWELACALLLNPFSGSSGTLSLLAAATPGRSSLNAALSACAEASRWERALLLLQGSTPRMLRVHPDTVNFNCGLHACARASQWSRALLLLEEMLQHRQPPPDVASFSIAMTACEKGGRSGQALQVMSAMREAGYRPDAVSFSACVSACEKAARWETALRVLAEATSSGNADPVSRNAAISACEKGAQWERALLLLARLCDEQSEPGPVGCGAALGACARASRWAEAAALLNKFGLHHLGPGWNLQARSASRAGLDVVCLTSALHSLEQAGQLLQGPATAVALAAVRHCTAEQLQLAARARHGAVAAAAARAHAASTGGLGALQAYGLLGGRGPLQVLRRRASRPAAVQLQGLTAEPSLGGSAASAGVRSPLLQSLCDLGGPCTRDTSEDLRLRGGKAGAGDVWQDVAREVITESLAAPMAPDTSWEERQALLFGAFPTQATASRIVTWTLPQLQYKGPAGSWKLCSPDGEVTLGGKRESLPSKW
ncbi:unnamed protein product [Polarella glacialis]|uniref:Pentatricopeptide repeat-containing protein, chloroplastic n=1 Tax=Polarella glacialis TaxID=89957 RepID=A0A813GAL6_POLGL|nr:unnamed protein product [Polarella glacialis]